MFVLLAPKLLGYIALLLNPRELRACGGCSDIWGSRLLLGPLSGFPVSCGEQGVSIPRIDNGRRCFCTG